MTANKLDKKDIMEPDKFHTITHQVVAFVMANKKPFLVGAGVAALLVVAVTTIFLYALYYEHQAEKTYASVAATYIAGSNVSKNTLEQQQKSIDVYHQVISHYPRSDAAVLAYYSLGNAYYEMNNIDKAIDAYQMFIKKTSQDNVLTPLAYYGLGYCYERNKDFENALQAFQSAEKLMRGDEFKAINLQNLARTYEKMNNRKDALEYYKEALKASDDPFMNLIIKSRIAALS